MPPYPVANGSMGGNTTNTTAMAFPGEASVAGMFGWGPVAVAAVGMLGTFML